MNRDGTCYTTSVLILMLATAREWSLSWHRPSHSTLPHPLFLLFILIAPAIHSFVSSFQVFRQKFRMHFSPVSCVSSIKPIPYSRFQHNIWWELHLMKLLRCSLFNPLFILLSHFQQGISLGPFLNAADKFSRTSQTLKMYLVFYIFIQNLKGRRILNLMLTSIFFRPVCFYFLHECNFDKPSF